ncbi:membrane protein of ER body-like protein [Neltuma alba]|uniref:membrane protein of ER body-like protein n=1 Tax=Neltuma alba TaxID=207710 RepID=UPI0010A3908B|nr:membrane protein of ER body-like protein [Prosopis alba]
MEGLLKQWKEEAEAEAEVEEEVGLVRRQAHEQVTTFTGSDIHIQGQEISETKDDSGGIEKKDTTSPSSDPIIPGDSTPPKNVTIQTEKRQEISETKDGSSFSDIEKKNITLPSSDPIIYRDATLPKNVAVESERVGVITENIQLAKELYLESLYLKPPTQGFYCPNCRACIQKVLILDPVREEPDTPAQSHPQFERFRCSTCFSFLIPIGSWVLPWLVRDKEEVTEDAPKTKVPPPEEVPPHSGSQMLQPEPIITDGAHKTQEDEQGPDGSRTKPSRWGVLASASAIAVQKKPEVDISKIPERRPAENGVDGASTDLSHQIIDVPEGEQGPDGSRAKPSQWGLLASASAIAIPKKPQVDISKIPEQQKPIDEAADVGVSTEPLGSTTSASTTTAGAVQEPGSGKTWDIPKSIVYGGLIESIASLSIVASSASADATTLSILALSLANLIGGLFILVHHMWDLKSEQQGTNELVDRYYLSLGKRENFYLHVFIATLSFIIFGIVPPLVYGLTFYEINNKDLTLVAVAGASVICITLLSIAKTYIQRPNSYLTYLKTVIYYLSTGALSSVLSYLAGVLIRKLLEKLGFGSESSLGFTLTLPEMSITEKPRFGSY